ncbi:LapA family protein [Pseudogracilibacillus sp. SO30301A]|uniref:LapA family protein n=1 Tax=Pseudogracilibacillus sp. SO30301A TaxID=3098291 RepID=UPI00300DC8FC
MQKYFILSLIVSIIVVIFAVTNAAAVPVTVFFTQYEISLALIIIITTAFGAIIATMIALVKQFNLNKQIKSLTTKNQTLMLENKKLQEVHLPTTGNSPADTAEEKNNATDI